MHAFLMVAEQVVTIPDISEQLVVIDGSVQVRTDLVNVIIVWDMIQTISIAWKLQKIDGIKLKTLLSVKIVTRTS